MLPSCVLSLSALLAVAPPDAFTRSPTDLLAWAAEGAKTPTAAAEVLLDSTELAVQPDGRERWRTVLIYRVLDQEALPKDLKEIRADWNWTSTRPEVRARVVSADGAEHWFDRALLSEAADSERPNVYSDHRVLRGPLPAIARGAVVEVEVRSVVTPWARSGSNFRIPLQNFYPTRRLTVRVEVPRDSPFHVTETGAQWVHTTREEAGRRVLTLEVPSTAALELNEFGTPEDYPSLPSLWISTTPDWQSAAAEYSGIVDRVLESSDLHGLAQKVIGETRDPRVAANRILTWMAPLRYASVGLGDTSVVPRTPTEVLNGAFSARDTGFEPVAFGSGGQGAQAHPRA